MKLERIALEWLEQKRKFIKLSTYAYYRAIINNYIIPDFGDINIEKLNENQIQNQVLQWQKKGKNTYNGLKVSTIKNMLMVLKQCMKYAQKTRNTGWFETSIHYAVADRHKTKQVFNVYEQREILSAAISEFSSNSLKSLGIIFAINCGIRIGELCALQWKDIDFENQVMTISKTLQRIYLEDGNHKTQVIITTPKTLYSIREIPLPQNLMKLIRSIHIKDKNNYVLTNQNRYIEPRTYRDYYKKFLQRHGIPTLSFHSLRHTFATVCVEKGADIKSISNLLGHSTINTTLNMYVHPGIEEKRKCIELLDWYN